MDAARASEHKARHRKVPGLCYHATRCCGIIAAWSRGSQKGMPFMTPKLTTPLVTPITDYSLACDRLLDDSITHDALTKDELSIIKMSVQRITEKFLNGGSARQPVAVPPVVLPHGSGGPVE